MKILFLITAVSAITNCSAQTGTLTKSSAVKTDTSSSKLIYFEDFNNNKNNWTVGDNKNVSSRIDGGIYYLTAMGHAYGEAQEVKIDSRKDFAIETRIKFLSGNPDHKKYYSMLFWGREAMNGYYFTFAQDGFVSVEQCDGKNQNDCITANNSLKKSTLSPDEFNVYTIKKTGSTYSFYVNGTQVYQMPFAPFFGNFIGIGAGRKVSLAIDYLKVVYL